MPLSSRFFLCPGQGAQAVGMGQAWCERSPAARATFQEADTVLGAALGTPLSTTCFHGPAETLNRTDVAQPALYACSVASYRGLAERDGDPRGAGAAGLSLGEYTALQLAGAFDFATGLRLVAERGRLMQRAAEKSRGGMVALIGADEPAAAEICSRAADGEVLVCANFNAPGQVVLSGHRGACERAAALAAQRGLAARALDVAGAFHSPLMQPAADGLAAALLPVPFQPLRFPVWSNVTASPHEPGDPELLKARLVQQITSPVRWAETCQRLAAGVTIEFHELAPGAVLRGLMRRVDRNLKVTSHDQPDEP